MALPSKACRFQNSTVPTLTSGRLLQAIHYSSLRVFRLDLGSAVEQGNAEAWFHMGVMYLNGWGVKPSHRQALECFTIAAQVGHVLGMYNLAVMHLNGRAGLPAADASLNCPPALALMKRIAEKGSWGGLVQQVCNHVVCDYCSCNTSTLCLGTTAHHHNQASTLQLVHD